MAENARRRRAVLRRDGPGCHWCGSADDSTLDHVIPKSMGGTNEIDNLVLSCEPCNQARGGVHGPGANRPGSPSVNTNGHERFVQGTIPDPEDPRRDLPPPPKHVQVTVSKVKIPKPGPSRQETITANGIRPEVADAFVDAIEARQMEKALQRLESKYGPAVRYAARKDDNA